MSSTSSSSSSTSDIVSIHEQVLSFLKSSDLWNPTSLENPSGNHDKIARRNHDYLREIQQRRISLASEVATLRAQSQRSTVDLRQRRRRRKQEPKEFLEETASALDSFFAAQNHEKAAISSTNADTVDFDAINNPNLAVFLQQARKKQKLQAAYRLGGITAAIPQDDPEVLSIRFDICLDGNYVACYHAYFDLVVMASSEEPDQPPHNKSSTSPPPTTSSPKGDETTSSSSSSSSSSSIRHGDNTTTNNTTNNNTTNNNNNNNINGRKTKKLSIQNDGGGGGDDGQLYTSSNDCLGSTNEKNPNCDDQKSFLYLRLTQHTLPSSIPLLDISEATLGGSLFCLGDLQNKNDWQTDTFQKRLRSWCRQCYKACSCWERRQQAWSYLENYQQQHKLQRHQKQTKARVDFLTANTSGSLDRISFEVTLPVAEKTLAIAVAAKVQLVFGDWVHDRPTDVQVDSLPRSTAESSHAVSNSLQQQKQVLIGDQQDKLVALEHKFAELLKQAFQENHVHQSLDLVQERWQEISDWSLTT